MEMLVNNLLVKLNELLVATNSNKTNRLNLAIFPPTIAAADDCGYCVSTVPSLSRLTRHFRIQPGVVQTNSASLVVGAHKKR